MPAVSLIRNAMAVLALLAWASAPARAEGLMNLRKPEAPRFPVTEITWPEQPGNASICLWEDDKLAAFSFGIDDNNAMNVDWWLEQTKLYNIKITWFLITGSIGDSKRSHQSGTWEIWQKVVAEGHAVESHSVNHLGKVGEPDWPGTEWEYSESRRQIEAGLPGYRVLTIAYPGGKGQETNDPSLAAKHYIAGRSTYPLPNPANTIDYLMVNGSSNANVRPLGENPKVEFANFNNILTPNRNYKAQYRGWAFGFWHYIGTDEHKKTVLAVFDWYKANADKLWAGLFRDIARYGQERDTAKLEVGENTADRITFTLTDQMDDSVFDYPLTVKVRVPDAWKNPKAVQQEKEIPVTPVEHEGGKYLLVKAIPDRGPVVLQSR